MISLVNTK